MPNVRLLLSGDTAVTVEFGNEISEEINKQIRAFGIVLEKAQIPGITELVPTYRSMMVHYDPGKISYKKLVAKLEAVLGGLDQVEIPPSDVLEIPVLYGGEMGPDLAFVAEHAHMSLASKYRQAPSVSLENRPASIRSTPLADGS